MNIENKLVFVVSIFIFALFLGIYKASTVWYIDFPAIIVVVLMIEWNYEVNARTVFKINWFNKH